MDPNRTAQQPTDLSTDNRLIAERLQNLNHDSQLAGVVESSGENQLLTIGKYQIQKLLSSGGQAYVLLAYDPQLDRQVVIKLYHRGLTEVQLGKLRAEGRALAKIQNPYVVNCFGFEVFGDQPALVMEYVAGYSLGIIRDLPFEEPRAIRIALKIAHGVNSFHRHGLLHRDLKPGNVMINDEDNPRIIDFGLATSMDDLSSSDSSGTPAFMPPERARNDFAAIDGRSDVFGVGAILYYLLTGNAPFPGSDNEDCRQLAVVGDVPAPRTVNPRISREVNEICVGCLKREVHQRTTIEDLVAQLQSLDQPVTNRWTGRILAMTCLLVVMATGIWISQGRLNFRNSGEGLAASESAGVSSLSRLETVFQAARHDDTGVPLLNEFEIEVLPFETAWEYLNPDEVEKLGGRRVFPPTENGLHEFELGHAIVLKLRPKKDCYVQVYAFEEGAVPGDMTTTPVPANPQQFCVVKRPANQIIEVPFTPRPVSGRTEHLYIMASTAPFQTRINEQDVVPVRFANETSRGIEPFHDSTSMNTERLIPLRVLKTVEPVSRNNGKRK